MTKQLWLAAIAASIAAPAMAQPTTDGTLVGDEAFYGAALFVQDTRTSFGDGSGNPDPLITGNNLADGGGSEIDQVFMTVSGGRLHVLIAGNLEANFNKMQVFIDTSASTGVGMIDGAALPAAFDGFCCGGLPVSQNGTNTTGEGGLQRISGFTFDTQSGGASADFTADYALSFTHGRETVNPDLGDEVEFYGSSAHFADLTQGTAGAVGGLGMQLAPRGLPQVLRNTPPPVGDYNENGTVDAADYTLWRDNVGAAGGTLPNDATGEDPIDGPGGNVYNQWAGAFGSEGVQDGLGAIAFAPFGNPGNTEQLLGPSLPNLAQGELIDRNYALDGSGGGCTDNAGTGCIAPELEFALPVDPAESGTNESSHRNFNNFVDLRMAIDNSNTAGITGSGSDFAADPLVDNPQDVVTGIEFSIPLDQIGITGGAPTEDIRLMAMVNANSYEFLSNQITGGNPGNVLEGLDRNHLGGAFFNDPNTGDPPLFTLDTLAGDQFVTLSFGSAVGVPEPTAVLLAGLAAVGLAARRRG